MPERGNKIDKRDTLLSYLTSGIDSASVPIKENDLRSILYYHFHNQ